MNPGDENCGLSGVKGGIPPPLDVPVLAEFARDGLRRKSLEI